MNLVNLARHDVIDPHPSQAVAAQLYVPRQDLNDTAARLEDHVLRDLRQEHRVALIGPPGSGKTSLTAWLASHNHDLVAVHLPVSVAQLDVSDAGIVLNDCIAHLKRLMNATDDTQLRLRDIKASAEVGFSWAKVGAEASWAAAVTQHTGGVEARAAFEVLQQVVDGLHADDKLLLLVFDDTDKWNATRRDDPKAIRDFFHGVIEGWLSQLEGALIASVHNDYLDPHPNILDGFNATHHLTTLTATAVRDLLSTRFALADLDINDVLTDDALDVLTSVYIDRGNSIRSVLQALKVAVNYAIDANQPKVATPHVLSAL